VHDIGVAAAGDHRLRRLALAAGIEDRRVRGLWREERFSFEGRFYRTEEAICSPKPAHAPILYAGGESEAAKTMIATRCDAYVMHGDPAAAIAPKIADMRARRAAAGGASMTFGMAAYAIVRDSEADAKRELARITDVRELPAGYANFDQWLSGTQLERELKIQEYSVSNRGLRPNLVGTPEQLKERIAEYEAAGLDLLLLQMSPQAEEMERFAAQVIN
jgi:FMNH2-dependent dimethyl sulfone monooxygenase